MKLLRHPDIQEMISLDRNGFTSLIIENPVFYRQIRKELHDQALGEEGRFLFYDGEKEKPLTKSLTLVEDPLNFVIDEKKMNLLLQKDIAGHITVSQKEEYQLLLHQIGEYIRSISYDSPVAVSFDSEMTLASFLKCMSVTASETDGSFLETILSQTRRISIYLGINVFAFIGLEDLLTKEELSYLSKRCGARNVTSFSYLLMLRKTKS